MRQRPAFGFNSLVGVLAVVTAMGFFSPQVTTAQVIRGFVTDALNSESLEGATVAIRLDSVLVAGAASDRDGFFALSRFPQGTYTLTVSYVGFLTTVDTLFVGANQILLRNYQLTATEGALDELLVSGDRDSGLTRVDAGRVSIRPSDIALIPSPDISADLVNYLSAIPGLVTVGDRGGQLFVRGGEPWQNLVLLDGMWVYQPFHVLGFFSAFPADILSQVDVYAGGYGAKYGGRISSVIDVRSRTGSKSRYSGAVSAAPFVTSALIEGPIADEKLSFLISIRESVLEQGAEHLVSQPLPFTFGDLFAKVHGLLTANSQVSLTMLRTHDAGTVGEAEQIDAGGEDVARWKNQAYGFRYLVLPSNFPVLADFNISYSRLQTGLGSTDNPVRSGRLGTINTTADITHFSGDVEVNWGVFARTMELSTRLGGLFQNSFRRHEFVTEVGIYVEPSIRLENGMEGSAGIRVHNFPSKNRVFFEPRLRGAWDRGKDRFSIAAGVYHQEVIGLTDRRDAAGVFTAWTTVPFSSVPAATHFILGYSRDLNSQVSIGLEAYHKRLTGLFVPEWTAFPRFTTKLQPASGRVWGGDFRFEARGERFLTTITYGLSAVEYRAKQESLQLWYGTDEIAYRPGHDRRHQLNVLGAYRAHGFAISVRWQFGSGLPFSRALGFDGFVLLDEPVDVFSEPGSRRVIYEEPFNGRLPTYHRLDISVEKQFLVPGGNLTAQAGIINVYDRANLFYLDTFSLTRINQLPFIPTFGLKYGFGQ